MNPLTADEMAIVAWDCSEDAEELTWETKDEAIEAYLDQLPRDEWPVTLTVYGFSREKPDWNWFAEQALENLLESIDENHGDPDERTSETESMKNAATEFVMKVAAEYEIWSCKQTTSIEVNVMDWVKEHRPNWLRNPQ